MFVVVPDLACTFRKTILRLVNSATKRQLGTLDPYSLSEFISCSKVSPATLVTALIFVEKFKNLNPKPRLFSEITATELLIVATMAASKYLHDTDTEEAFCNVDWATEFNLELKSLNRLEVRFLYSLDWCLFVSKAEFATFVSRYLSIKTCQAHSSNRPPIAHEGRNASSTTIPEACAKSRTTANCHFPSGLNPKWPLAKAVTVFAAAFLAVSQPPTSTIVTGPSADPHNDFDQLTTSARLVTSQLSALVGFHTDSNQNHPNFLPQQLSMPNSSFSDESLILDVLFHRGSTCSHPSSAFASHDQSRCQNDAFLLPPVGVR
ncbi:unnamed protein product [Dibothriocephalus latus]|uniref:Protein CNPPD1 n=1 Tax=Dibothriocephalus latus TaxID=60516 RepID=A0A3P7P4I3_DIBLA|nr:unnamed protein product [Dibothriocephalus latus]